MAAAAAAAAVGAFVGLVSLVYALIYASAYTSASGRVDEIRRALVHEASGAPWPEPRTRGAARCGCALAAAPYLPAWTAGWQGCTR